jgi:hypothetical protein
MNSDKINTILKVHPEMTIREIQKIPEILEDPVLVLKSRNVGGARSQYRNSRMTVFGSVKAQDGRTVMCVMDLRPTENGFLMADMQKVNSAYTKDTNQLDLYLQVKCCMQTKKEPFRFFAAWASKCPCPFCRVALLAVYPILVQMSIYPVCQLLLSWRSGKHPPMKWGRDRIGAIGQAAIPSRRRSWIRRRRNAGQVRRSRIMQQIKIKHIQKSSPK